MTKIHEIILCPQSVDSILDKGFRDVIYSADYSQKIFYYFMGRKLVDLKGRIQTADPKQRIIAGTLLSYRVVLSTIECFR